MTGETEEEEEKILKKYRELVDSNESIDFALNHLSFQNGHPLQGAIPFYDEPKLEKKDDVKQF